MGEPDGTMATTTPCLSASCWFVRLACVPRPLASDSLSYSLMRSGAALSRATTCGGLVVYSAAMRTWSSSPGSVRFRSRSCTRTLSPALELLEYAYPVWEPRVEAVCPSQLPGPHVLPWEALFPS